MRCLGWEILAGSAPIESSSMDDGERAVEWVRLGREIRGMLPVLLEILERLRRAHIGDPPPIKPTDDGN